MPVKQCTMNGQPGYKWGDEGKCYTYRPGSEAARMAAKRKAIRQGLAATGGKLEENDGKSQ